MSAISSISSAAVDLSSAVSVAVAVKAKDVAKAQGEAAVSLLESAVKLQNQVASASTNPVKRLDVKG